MLDKDYKTFIKENNKAILLISGQGCANCVTMYPIVNKLVENYPEIMLNIIEAEESYRELIEAYDIEKVPSILLFDKGELIAKISGYQPYEIFEYYVKDKFKL